MALPPLRHKPKSSNSTLLLLVLVVLIGAFAAYMFNGQAKPPSDPDPAAKPPTKEEQAQIDKDLAACREQRPSTGECQIEGGEVRFKCDDKRYGTDCSKTCHTNDGISQATYSPGFDSGAGAATCTCPDGLQFKNRDVARGGCLLAKGDDGATCAEGFRGKDCSEKIPPAVSYTKACTQLDGWEGAPRYDCPHGFNTHSSNFSFDYRGINPSVLFIGTRTATGKNNGAGQIQCCGKDEVGPGCSEGEWHGKSGAPFQDGPFECT